MRQIEKTPTTSSSRTSARPAGCGSRRCVGGRVARSRGRRGRRESAASVGPRLPAPPTTSGSRRGGGSRRIPGTLLTRCWWSGRAESGHRRRGRAGRRPRGRAELRARRSRPGWCRGPRPRCRARAGSPGWPSTARPRRAAPGVGPGLGVLSSHSWCRPRIYLRSPSPRQSLPGHEDRTRPEQTTGDDGALRDGTGQLLTTSIRTDPASRIAWSSTLRRGSGPPGTAAPRHGRRVSGRPARPRRPRGPHR